VVLNSWAYGLHNGAFCFDEAVYDWLNCVVVTTSTGNVTSSERQVELAIQYGAAAILTTGDYLLRLADVAREMGYDPSRDLALCALPNIGDADALTSLFGVEYFRTYGFHEVGCVAVECSAHDGLHVFEDAFIVQIVDPDTGERVPDGQLGSVCLTEVCKTGSPQFRDNIMDPSYLYPPGAARMRQLAATDRPVQRPRRQHGQAARRQCVARGHRRHRLLGRGHPS
jgi:phenylacetate-CoA ligase